MYKDKRQERMKDCPRLYIGHALEFMLGATLEPRAARSDPHGWGYFDQRPFLGGGASGLAPRGVVYTPAPCRAPRRGAACRLHINLHGCGMAEVSAITRTPYCDSL